MKASEKEPKKDRMALAPTAHPAKEEMVTQYLPLVRLVAERVHRRLPPGVDLESLIHSGVVGLLQALDRFDPKRGVDFEIYARYRIQGEVMQCLRSLDWVRRSVRSWGRKIEAAKTKLAGNFAREPTTEEIAKELGVPLESYFRLDQQVNDATLLSLLLTSDVVVETAQHFIPGRLPPDRDQGPDADTPRDDQALGRPEPRGAGRDAQRGLHRLRPHRRRPRPREDQDHR